MQTTNITYADDITFIHSKTNCIDSKAHAQHIDNTAVKSSKLPMHILSPILKQMGKQTITAPQYTTISHKEHNNPL